MLYRGACRADAAREVGFRLAHIHARAAQEPELLACFDHMASFKAIRLEPYLLATAEHHPDLREPLLELAEHAAQNKRSLIHGDVSPKNLLLGPDGPVFLDAECACWGDPAFDIAFCVGALVVRVTSQNQMVPFKCATVKIILILPSNDLPHHVICPRVCCIDTRSARGTSLAVVCQGAIDPARLRIDGEPFRTVHFGSA